MIKNIAKKSLILALLAGIGLGANLAQAQERVYVIDQQPSHSCWHLFQERCCLLR